MGVVLRLEFWALPRHPWSGPWGVCVFVRVPGFYPAIPGTVVCVCVGLGFVCSPVFSWLVCWGAWPPVCAASVSRLLLGRPPVAWGCAGVAVGGVCPPPLPFFFFFSRLRGRSCVVFGPVVLWLCDVRRWLSRSWVSWSLSPLPLLFRLRLHVFFFLLFFFCPSLPERGVCWRVRGVLSSGGPLLSVGCRRFWLGGPPVFLRGPRGCRFRGFLAWGFARLLWCGCAASWLWAYLMPPPFFFPVGGGLPVPPSAFAGLVHALVGIRCG